MLALAIRRSDDALAGDATPALTVTPTAAGSFATPAVVRAPRTLLLLSWPTMTVFRSTMTRWTLSPLTSGLAIPGPIAPGLRCIGTPLTIAGFRVGARRPVLETPCLALAGCMTVAATTRLAAALAAAMAIARARMPVATTRMSGTPVSVAARRTATFRTLIACATITTMRTRFVAGGT